MKEVILYFISVLHRVVKPLIGPRLNRFVWSKLSSRQKGTVEKIQYLYGQRAVTDLKTRLVNLGFHQRAYDDLLMLVKDKRYRNRRRLAAWELALWHANRYTADDANHCLRFLRFVKNNEKKTNFLNKIAILEAECNILLGEQEKAASILSEALKYRPTAELYLAVANLESSLPLKIKWINKALELYGIPPVSYTDGGNRSPFSRLAISHLDKRLIKNKNEQAKVSVIVTAFNAENTIRSALESIISQTWKNLEVLIVDDSSTDSTVAICKDYCQLDKRFKLIRSRSNEGLFISRNKGFKIATGEFLTCHDADVWSHPMKIQIQVEHLLNNVSVIGNTSQHIQTNSEFTFIPEIETRSYIFSDLSSFMFRRYPVLQKIGYWDSVRMCADEEFIRRLKRVYGGTAVIEDLKTGPISFQDRSEQSLTAQKAIGYVGLLMSLSKEYNEASNHYHNTQNDIRYEFPMKRRPFPVPEPMQPKRKSKSSERRHFDVIIASDFRMIGGSVNSNMEEIKAQRQMGIRTGLVQMSRYDMNPEAEIIPQVRELIDGDLVQMLVYGEKVECDVLIIRYPPVLQELQEYIPDVQADNICVIVNQTPMSDYGKHSVVRYDIEICEQHIKKYFKKSAVWYPIGPQVRKALLDHHAEELSSVNLSDTDWANIINIDEWKREVPPIHNNTIRIGRHARDHYLKWPHSREEILSIYPDKGKYEVYILGGADTPLTVLGQLPKNWHIFNFGEIHPQLFLEKLDIFVYYVHHDLVESFGRSILEAMAAGVPVILPTKFQQVFRSAAVYAEPEDVIMTIENFMNDEDFYQQQIDIALRYVQNNFGYNKHIERLDLIKNKDL